jgi:poly(3-hydroxybutyrate) depolymerase
LTDRGRSIRKTTRLIHNCSRLPDASRVTLSIRSENHSMASDTSSKIVQLESYTVRKGQSSISGLSSGAFMTVQLHLAHSSSFSGVGVIAGGPFRCAESFRGAAPLAEDAYVQSAEYICMSRSHSEGGAERTSPPATGSRG